MKELLNFVVLCQ